MSYKIITIALLSLLMVSSLAVVWNKYKSTQLFIEMQHLEKQRDLYNVEWKRLQLELSTLAGQGRIEQLAISRLGLSQLSRDRIVFIKP